MQACTLPHNMIVGAEARPPSRGCAVFREMAMMPSRVSWHATMRHTANPLPVAEPKQVLRTKLGNAVLTTNPVQADGSLMGSASLLAGYNAVLIKREFKRLKEAREREKSSGKTKSSSTK